MKIQSFQRAIDGVIWRCNSCSKTISIRKNTFFREMPLDSVYTISNNSRLYI
uniref:Uncharacterized protein n=1 Tax=Octopus bimaculoides TaxID=37653 RepID=A0A0L8HW27_OCTBM